MENRRGPPRADRALRRATPAECMARTVWRCAPWSPMPRPRGILRPLLPGGKDQLLSRRRSSGRVGMPFARSATTSRGHAGRTERAGRRSRPVVDHRSRARWSRGPAARSPAPSPTDTTRGASGARRVALTDWRDAVRLALRDMDVPPGRARELATRDRRPRRRSILARADGSTGTPPRRPPSAPPTPGVMTEDDLTSHHAHHTRDRR